MVRVYDKDATKKLRKKYGKLKNKKILSRDDLGKAVGVTRQTVRNWEIGHCPPETPSLIMMMALYDVEFGYFWKEIK